MQKTKESQERKEKEGQRRIDKHTEEGQTKGGREGGKETEQRERQRRQEISASNPNKAVSASRSGSFPARKGLQLRCRSPLRWTARLQQEPKRRLAQFASLG